MKNTWIAVILLASMPAGADERILSYHSDIIVHADSSVEVTETIRVRAEGREIRRGIYRDFPTDYRDRFGNRYRVRFEPLGVLRNDTKEDFHAEKMGRYVRVYFGNASRLIERGVHTYTFRYAVDRMLGYFDDTDEFYWNVTGNGWNFPIDEASATVALDFDVPASDIVSYAYTGPFGSNGQDYRASVDHTGKARFETSRNLGAREGLTIAVAWPKGFVDEPRALQKTAWLLADNVNLLVAAAGLLAIFSYYVPTWRSYGKDPEPGVIFTRYEPPTGFSPASLRYIEQMHYDDTAMTAAIVSLAVKGYLRIDEHDDEYTVTRVDPGGTPAPLATGERELHDALFGQGDTVILDDEYHERIGDARQAHEISLSRDYKSRYFRTNTLLIVPGILIAIISAIVALNIGEGPTIAVIVTIVLMPVAIIIFAFLMRRPTALGRRLLDEVHGFREYLDIAEKDELNLRNPPDKTPQLFEAYLPFALAMGVEQHWAERFASVFARLERPDGSEYHPSWYSGSWDSFDMGNSTANLSSSLGSAVSASVSPPGSSSGSGGGGSSGGGGGGGGGGGW